MTIPEPAFWSFLGLAAMALIGIALKVRDNSKDIGHLQETGQTQLRCAQLHAKIDVELTAISKDVEGLARKAGLEPQPSPARNGGEPRED